MNLRNHQYLVIALSIILLANSCQNKEYEFPKAPEQVFLTEENMPPVEYFTLEKVELPKNAFSDRYYYLHADTLLFTQQNKSPNPYLLSVYNLKTQEFVAGYFTKGIGPNELISVHCTFRDNEILVIDIAQNKVAILSIDSIALLRQEYVPTIISVDGICTEYARCVNDTLIGINDFHFYGFGYENVPEFVKISCSDGKFPKNYMPKEIKGTGPMNINMRTSQFNEHTKQYVVAWHNYPYINIYDENFNLQKQYIGPDNIMPNLAEIGKIGVCFIPDSVRSKFYVVGCQTKNYTFFLNYRFYGSGYNWKKLNPEIFCFDKSLNLVRRMKQKFFKTTLLNPSYCEGTGNLYFSGEDEDTGDWVLYKCVFEK